MNNIPRITYGNDFNIKIYMNEMIGNDDVVPYDLTNCTDIQVQMFCSKHKTMFELPFTIDPEDSSIIIAQIDYRLTHPNTMYGFVVNGYDEDGQHFQWCQKPSEGIMIVEGSSGALIDESMDNTIDISARIGFNLNLSNYYDKEEIAEVLTNYVDKGNDLSKYRVVVPYVHYRTITNVDRLNFTVQVYNNVTNELVYQPASGTPYYTLKQYLRDVYGIEFRIFVTAEDIYHEFVNVNNVTGLPEYIFGVNDRKEGYAFCSYKSIYDEEQGRYENYYEALKRGHVISFVKTYYQKISDVAVSGSYDDLSNKPFIPTNTSDLTNDSGFVTQEELETKQDVLVSGTNIKTINNQSILGEGNIDIQGGGGDQVQSDWEQEDDTQVDYIKNKPEFAEPKIEFVEEAPTVKDQDTIYVESPVYDIQETSIDIVDEAPAQVEDGKIVIVSNPIQLKTINNQEIVGEGNIEVGGGGEQVQSDWSQTDNTQVDYIKNKPDLSIYAESSDLANVATSGSYNDLSDKPTIPAAQVQSNWNETNTSSKAYIQNKPDLSIYAQSSSLARVATSGSYNDLSNQPDLSEVAYSGEYNDIINTPNLARVATSGSYNDLSNKPDLSIYAESSNLANVATSGSYYDLDNAPILSEVASSGDYNDLINTPDLSIYAESSNLANVATSGSYYDLDNAPILSEVASSGDYNDLINKPTIPAAQVQSNWNETNTSSKAYIQNKPTIPAAQVQSNWNETNTSSKAYIQNKPNVVTSTTTGLKIEVVSALPPAPDNNTIYIIQ